MNSKAALNNTLIIDRLHYRLQTRDEEQSNCPAKERKKKNLAMGPKGVPDTKTDRPTDRRSQHQHQLNSTQLNSDEM
jgi:hypothetical protein